MSWEWSHTDEGIAHVRDNIVRLDEDIRQEIECEWAAYRAALDVGDASAEPFDEEAYEDCQPVGDPETIFGYAAELRVCTNGGFEAWVCPYGCHTVSFSAEPEEDLETLEESA